MNKFVEVARHRPSVAQLVERLTVVLYTVSAVFSEINWSLVRFRPLGFHFAGKSLAGAARPSLCLFLLLQDLCLPLVWVRSCVVANPAASRLCRARTLSMASPQHHRETLAALSRCAPYEIPVLLAHHFSYCQSAATNQSVLDKTHPPASKITVGSRRGHP